MSEYVKVKDLVPGNVYFAGSGWRNIYLYCGRNKQKQFVWYFIGNIDAFAAAPTFDYVLDSMHYLGARQICVTTTNKKVRALTPANLKYFYANNAAVIQGLCGKTIDMHKCTQETLEYMSTAFYTRKHY